jgi:D-lactate dehydrogenase (cytochrome)
MLHAHTAAGRTVRIRGAGAPPAHLPAADVTMSTEQLRGIETYARDDLFVSVRAGTPLSELQAALAGDGVFVPLASPWPGATIGGIVATALNAPLRLRYGGVRDLVLAATVALPDGRVIKAGRPVVKNVAGYDLPKLFVGSHGTLGLLADVTLKIVPLPRARQTLVMHTDTSGDAARIAAALVPICLNASALVVYPAEGAFVVAFSVEGTPEEIAVELQEAEAAARAAGAGRIEPGAADGTTLWAAWLARSVNARRLGVPPGSIVAVFDTLAHSGMLEQAAWFADATAGHVYLDGADDAALQQIAAQSGGYLAGITGAGAHQTYFQPPGAALMKRVRAHFGAAGLLNSGVLAFD